MSLLRELQTDYLPINNMLNNTYCRYATLGYNPAQIMALTRLVLVELTLEETANGLLVSRNFMSCKW